MSDLRQVYDRLGLEMRPEFEARLRALATAAETDVTGSAAEDDVVVADTRTDDRTAQRGCEAESCRCWLWPRS